MRPTLLGLRSPKEKTPGVYFPNITYNGRSLSYDKPKTNNNFNKARRFNQYIEDSRKTGYQVGPGSYSIEIHKNKILGTPVFKQQHKLAGNNGYYYVGEHLVYDSSLNNKLRRRMSLSVDSTEIESYSFHRRRNSLANTPLNTDLKPVSLKSHSAKGTKKIRLKKRRLSVITNLLKKRFE